MRTSGHELRAAARDAAGSWRDLVRLSRPTDWAWTALPYLAGALDAQRGLGAAVVLGAIYFLGPFNLLRYGIDAVIGDDGRPTEQALPTALAIAVTNLPFLVMLAFLGGVGGTLALALTVGLAVVHVLPALRTRWWHELEPLTGALVLVGAAACGLLVGGRSIAALPWAILGAFWLWAAASFAVAAVARRGAIGTDTATATPRVPILSVRATAGLALVASAVAVALVARHGTLGLLAALGVALYLALPAMVLLTAHEPGAEDAAVRRALREAPGLDLLVGTWLALLLIRHWGLTTYSSWEVAVIVPAALTGYVLGSIVTTHFATRRRHVPEIAGEAPVPSVTIVVPCRNDADRLPACLAAIRSQTYADTTVLVVDQGSTDGTVGEAAAWLGEDAVLIAPPRPDGWRGRDWARHIGATAAETDLVLFVDADTVLAPIATRILVEQQQATGTDLLSGLTRFETRTVGERAAVPGFPLVLFGLVPVWWSALTAGQPPPLAFASATLLLLRREAYLGIVEPWGPPASVGPGGRLDLSLARAFARAGQAVRIVNAVDLAASRHHRDVNEAVGGWRRRIVPPLPGGLAMAVATIAVEVVAFLLPLGLPAAALLTDQPVQLVVAACVPLELLLAARIVLVVTQRHSTSTIAWHPVTILLALAGQVAGIADHIAGQAPRAHEREVPTPGSAAAGTGG